MDKMGLQKFLIYLGYQWTIYSDFVFANATLNYVLDLIILFSPHSVWQQLD